MDKHHEQFKDAANELGISDLDIEIVGQEACIYMGYATGENITLWRALQSIIWDVRIYYHHLLNNGACELKDDKLVHISDPLGRQYFSMREINWVHTHGNAKWFKKYSENKYLSHFILSKNNINQPRQIMFKGPNNMFYNKKRTEKRLQELKTFLDILPTDSEVVIKPVDWKCWENVFFCSKKEILELEDFINTNPEFVYSVDPNSTENDVRNELIRCGVVFGDVLFQERIQSYPIEVDKIKKDWNLRVLTTYDPEQKEYIVSWITWRIDNDWWPVNRSISADNISLEAIWKLAWWNWQTLDKVKKDVEKLAIHATTVMAYIWSRKGEVEDSIYKNFQNLAGIDIIVDKDLAPYIIEVNDSNSGCLYELMKLKWIEALTPIVKSVAAKVQPLIDANNEFEAIVANEFDWDKEKALEHVKKLTDFCTESLEIASKR